MGIDTYFGATIKLICLIMINNKYPYFKTTEQNGPN